MDIDIFVRPRGSSRKLHVRLHLNKQGGREGIGRIAAALSLLRPFPVIEHDSRKIPRPSKNWLFVFEDVHTRIPTHGGNNVHTYRSTAAPGGFIQLRPRDFIGASFFLVWLYDLRQRPRRKRRASRRDLPFSILFAVGCAAAAQRRGNGTKRQCPRHQRRVILNFFFFSFFFMHVHFLMRASMCVHW